MTQEKERYTVVIVRKLLQATSKTSKAVTLIFKDMPDISKEDRMSLNFRAINESPSTRTGLCTTPGNYGLFLKLLDSRKRGRMIYRANIVRSCANNVTNMNDQHALKAA